MKINPLSVISRFHPTLTVYHIYLLKVHTIVWMVDVTYQSSHLASKLWQLCYPTLPVSFGRDTKIHRSLLSGV